VKLLLSGFGMLRLLNFAIEVRTMNSINKVSTDFGGYKKRYANAGFEDQRTLYFAPPSYLSSPIAAKLSDCFATAGTKVLVDSRCQLTTASS